jgi:hypothetical protein
MRRLIAAACSAGIAVVGASPAIAAAPPPKVPSDAAIAQYIEVVPSATGPVPIGEAASPASGAALPTALRAKVERTAGVDAPALLDLAQDPRFGARPVRRANPTRGGPAIPGQAVLASMGTPSPFAAAASTASSGGLLFVALLLAGITAAGIAAKAVRR